MKALNEDRVLLGLIASRAVLERCGLAKHTIKLDGKVCTRGAILEVLGITYRSAWREDLIEYFNEIDVELKEAAPPQNPNQYGLDLLHIDYNNRKDTTLEDVLSMFDWAIERRKRKIQSWALAEAA